MFDDNIKKRNQQLRNLVVMAMADGSIGQREATLLGDRCVELGLGQDELHRALKFGLGEDAGLELPTNPVERMQLMKDLLRMIWADGKLEESEKRLFAVTAARMQIGRDQLDSILESLARGSKGSPPQQEGHHS